MLKVDKVLLRPVLAVLALSTSVIGNGNADFIHAIDQAQLAREEKLSGYTVTETYTLKNARFGESARMVVNVSYTKGLGKTYQVVSRQGSPFLQTSVLDRMLKEEGDLSRGEVRKNALVTSANYTMKPLGQQLLDGRLCEVFALTPRVKSPHLLQGKAWVDARTHNLMHIEGKPAASLSFWAGTPLVIRDYIEIGDFSFARRSEAVTQGLLLGRSELTVEYTDYRMAPRDATVNK